MPWKSRRNGRQYFYKTKRVNGKVVQEYVGRGPLVEMGRQADECEAMGRREASEAGKALAARASEADSRVESIVAAALAGADSYLGSLGYHRDPRRVWRKKRGERTGRRR